MLGRGVTAFGWKKKKYYYELLGFLRQGARRWAEGDPKKRGEKSLRTRLRLGEGEESSKIKESEGWGGFVWVRKKTLRREGKVRSGGCRLGEGEERRSSRLIVKKKEKKLTFRGYPAGQIRGQLAEPKARNRTGGML